MAVKKAKKSVKKKTAKKKAVKKRTVRKAAPKQQTMVCAECGRELVIDECGIAASTMFCCGQPMKAK